MTPTLLRKFSGLVDLGAPDRAALQSLTYEVATVERHRDILRVGDRPTFVYVILEGWAARYSLRKDGSRRITGFLLPGDFCGIHAVTSSPMDHALIALTTCKVGKIAGSEMDRLIEAAPVIVKALWRAKLTEEAILRMWLLNSEDAQRSLGHLLCELHARAHHAGLVEKGMCDVPLTQQDIGDALGITAVHTNRMLQQLRELRLVEFSHSKLMLPDVEALRRASSFDPAYLHM